MEPIAISPSMETPPDNHFRLRIFVLNGLHDAPSLFGCSRVHNEHDLAYVKRPIAVSIPHPFAHSVTPPRQEPQRANAPEKELAAGAKVSLRPALPFPRLLLLLPDRVHTPRNTSAISL